jgi:plastocyanin
LIGPALLIAGIAGALAATPGARAADAKVAIGHYHWSSGVVNIDLGQHVTWYWVGPDTMHSVTGISANAAGLDSDPQTNEPEHRVGDKFQLTFTQPGVYQFRCKLHPVVHGEVVVSATAGDWVFLSPARFSAAGTSLHFALDDPSVVDAEIWHASHGHWAGYAGWAQWRGHIGFNEVPFGTRQRHFKPTPGTYVAYIKPTDLFNNVGRAKIVRFTIRGPRGRR